MVSSLSAKVDVIPSNRLLSTSKTTSNASEMSGRGVLVLASATPEFQTYQALAQKRRVTGATSKTLYSPSTLSSCPRPMPRIRTFIAVEISPSVIARTGDLIDKLRVAPAEINWVRPQQMHLTLKFLGDIPDTETPDICRVVERVAASFEPFEITCRGAGAFPNVRDPRTLWIGIEDGAEELQRLQAQIDAALKSELGYAKEQRGF